MPLPASYLTSEERDTKTSVTSNYFDAKEIQVNEKGVGTADLIICGEPDDHMVCGYQYFLEKNAEGRTSCKITREEPSREEYLADCGLGFRVTKTKKQIMDIYKKATNRDEEWEALKLLSRPQYFLAFAAYHCEREEFVCVKVHQRSLLADIEKYLRMEEDYMPITKGGIYNFRMIIEKNEEGDGDNKRTTYGATVRIHRTSEEKEIEAIKDAWEQTKSSMYLPRYFMEKGANNVFDGKPVDSVLPKGMPVTASDEYGAETELKGW